MFNAMDRVRGDTVDQQDMDVRFVLIEAVNAVDSYVVEGVTITSTGPSQLRAGERVPVVFKGGVPFAILHHDARRAQFHPRQVVSSNAIVEELFIADDPSIDDGPTTDVYFRNFAQITNLKVTTQVPGGAKPLEVFWGVNPDVFCVRSGTDTYSVFRLNRSKTNRVYNAEKKAAVKEKLYDVTLSSTISLDLTTIEARWDRDSFEGTAHLNWSPGVLGPDCFFGVTPISLDRPNHNDAHVQRTVTIHLTGADTLSYQGSPIPADQFVDFGKLPNLKPKASLVSAVLDKNNDLIVSIKVAFDKMNLIQGNAQTGLTGSYSLVGDGIHVNGGVCFVASCPHVSDAVPTIDFMDHGGPGGIVTSETTETHALLVNARTGQKLFSTFNPAVTLHLEESTDGLTPYAQSFYTGMPVIGIQCYAQDFRSSPSLGVPIVQTVDFGNIGNVGITKSERSLFDPSIAFAPDVGAQRQAQVLSCASFTAYNQEPTDGFGRVCGVVSNCATAAAQLSWTTCASDVLNRYNVHVAVRPFYATASGVLSFVTVLREASRPLGFESDPHQVAVFILQGTTIFQTIMDYTTVQNVNQLPVYIDHIGVGSDIRLFWTQVLANGDTQVMMTDFAHAQSKIVGSNAAIVDQFALAITAPDFLYSADEKKLFFVSGWNRKTFVITLNAADERFPKRETALAAVGALLPLPKKLQGVESKSVQTIADTTLISGSLTT